MNVVSIEKLARKAADEHAKDVEAYSLGRFMDDLHDDEGSGDSESDRGAAGDVESA